MENRDFVQDIAALLVKHKVFSQAEANAAIRDFEGKSKEIFDSFLLREGLVERNDLLRILSEYYQVPSFDAVGYLFDSFLLHKFPKDFLLRNAIIPVDVDENMLIVLASKPDDPELEEMIGEYVSYGLEFMVGIKRDICDAVKEFYDKAPTEEQEIEGDEMSLYLEHDEELGSSDEGDLDWEDAGYSIEQQEDDE